MDWDEYIKWGEEVVHWGSNYRKNIRNFPVRSQNNPGDTYNLIPALRNLQLLVALGLYQP